MIRRSGSNRTPRFHGLSPVSLEAEAPGKAKYRGLTILNRAIDSVLDEYTGVIEGVKEHVVYLTLSKDGRYYEGEFSRSTFSPGEPIEIGRGVIVRRFQQRDDRIGWTIDVMSTQPCDPDELSREQHQLAQRFDGTGL